jgi:hypothetical protein
VCTVSALLRSAVLLASASSAFWLTPAIAGGLRRT